MAIDQGMEEVAGRPVLRRQQSIEARVKSAQYTILLVEDNLINVGCVDVKCSWSLC